MGFTTGIKHRVQDQIDYMTRWWSSFKLGKSDDYGRTRARTCYNSFVGETFAPVKRMARSASYSTLRGRNEIEANLGSLRRTNSYSSLAPSLGMPYRERSVERYVPQYSSYKPKTQSWRDEMELSSRRASLSRSIDRIYQPRTHTSRPSAPIWTPPVHRAPRLYQPTTVTRWEYARDYTRSKWLGLEPMMPFMYKNYWNRDETTSSRLYYTTRVMDGPPRLTKYRSTFYYTRPNRIIATTR